MAAHETNSHRRSGAMETKYEIEGNVLTQAVELDGAEFPVIADPRLEQNLAFSTLEFTRTETDTASSSTGGFLAICGAATVAFAPIGAVCGVLAGASVIVATQAKNTGKCLGLRIGNWGTAPFPVIVDCYALSIFLGRGVLTSLRPQVFSKIFSERVRWRHMMPSTEIRRIAFKTSFRKYSILFLAFCFSISVLQFFVWPGNEVFSTMTALLVPAVVFLYFFKLNASTRKLTKTNHR